MYKVIPLVLMGLCFGLSSFAEDPHPVSLGSITGDGVELKMYDHAVAGAIKGFVIWGYVDEATATAELTMRKDAQIIRATFQKNETGKFVGTIRHTVEGKEVVTQVTYKKLIPAENKILLDINGQELVAVVTPESVSGTHQVNPRFDIEYNGSKISYQMNGSGCFMYLILNTMMVTGAYFD